MEKLKKIEGGVDAWEEADIYEITSSYKYSADSYTELLVDNFNGFEINNVPLAFLIRSYPEHITVLAWGKSHTNDLPEQIREQQEDIMISGSPGDEDTEISDKYSSRLVVGNLTQSQLAEQDDLKNGFTGLIMEKNTSAELYRLAGYNKGVVQAEFDTEGKIVAGEGKTTLDEEGLTVLFNGDYSEDYHEPQSALKFRCVQDPNWESASLFSSMLKVNIPSQGVVNRENLTALTLNDGPAPDNIPSNLLLATSGSAYGTYTTEAKVEIESEPHLIQLVNNTFTKAVYMGNNIPMNSPGCYIGYNGNILSSNKINTKGISISSSGLKLKFTIEIKGSSGSYGGKVRLNYARFKFGEQYITINLGGIVYGPPPENQIIIVNTDDIDVGGAVIPCVGPTDVELDYESIAVLGAESTAYITSWNIGVYGCLSAESLGINLDNKLKLLSVLSDRYGGYAGNLNTAREVSVSHTSGVPINIQLITGGTVYEEFEVGVGVTEVKNILYNGEHYARCRVSYTGTYPTLNTVMHPSGNEWILKFNTTVTGGRGSMVFLRNDGAHIFGNLNISGGQNANVEYNSNGINISNSAINFEQINEVNLNDVNLKGSYESDGYPEASALKHIGGMMRVSVDNTISQNSVYLNETEYPIYVKLVHHHHWLVVYLTDTEGIRMLIHQSDGDGGIGGGTGKSTASFFVPPGWAWDCKGATAHKFATTFYFVGEGM